MAGLISFFRKYYSFIIKVLYFVFGAVLILLIVPKEGKFRYEIQKGKPWHHNDLIAPFDFPVLKSEKEIKAEEDSILSYLKPYFKYDEKVEVNFRKDYNERVTEFFESAFPDSLKTDSVFVRKYKDLGLLLEKEILDIYKYGIIQAHEIISDSTKNSTIVLLIDNFGEDVLVKNTFSPKTAYKEILYSFSKKVSDSIRFIPGFISAIELNQLLVPNFYYDESTSMLMQQKLLSEISETRGMVQSGERIISKGELVNSKKYQILQSLKAEYESYYSISSGFVFVVLGQALLIFACMLMLFLFILHFRKDIFRKNKNMLFINLLIITSLLGAILAVKVDVISLYLIPFAILPVIVRTFFDSRLALFVHLLSLLLIGFFVPNSFEFVFIQLLVGIIAIFSQENAYKRGQFFMSSFWVFIGYSIIFTSLNLVKEGDVSSIDPINYAWFAANSLLLLISYPIVYLVEKIFGFTSDVTLMELSDFNSPLLRKLAEAAPGTFQHSMQVANLAEEIVRIIGGNPLLVRTGALYHDIGKTNSAKYFIENQSEGINPHDQLSFEESADIIIGHVDTGVKLAKKHRLPKQIIDFIQTHHGTSVVQYFYISFMKQNPDEEVDISRFTYPGPIPFSKETVAVMMADSVEAASRSLKQYSETTISDLVEKIIGHQFKEGQYDDANITFKDMSNIKELLTDKLKNIYHTRIEYPSN